MKCRKIIGDSRKSGEEFQKSGKKGWRQGTDSQVENLGQYGVEWKKGRH